MVYTNLVLCISLEQVANLSPKPQPFHHHLASLSGLVHQVDAGFLYLRCFLVFCDALESLVH